MDRGETFRSGDRVVSSLKARASRCHACLVLSCLVLSCPVVSCRVVSCRASAVRRTALIYGGAAPAQLNAGRALLVKPFGRDPDSVGDVGEFQLAKKSEQDRLV